MTISVIAYNREATVCYHGHLWKVIGVKGDMRLIRLLGTDQTARVSVVNLDLYNT